MRAPLSQAYHGTRAITRVYSAPTHFLDCLDSAFMEPGLPLKSLSQGFFEIDFVSFLTNPRTPAGFNLVCASLPKYPFGY